MKDEQFILIGKNYEDTGDVPKGKNIFYRCGQCGVAISCDPKPGNERCKCRNILIDIDMLRLAVKDFTKFEVVEKV